MLFKGVTEHATMRYHVFDTPSLKGTEYHGTIEFQNGYSVSIVRHNYSYGGDKGLFEIMLMKDRKPCILPPITESHDTVRGFLSRSEVNALLTTIEGLPVVVRT